MMERLSEQWVLLTAKSDWVEIPFQHFKNIVVTFQNLQIIKTILTFRLSEYCKSGSTVS